MKQDDQHERLLQCFSHHDPALTASAIANSSMPTLRPQQARGSNLFSNDQMHTSLDWPQAASANDQPGHSPKERAANHWESAAPRLPNQRAENQGLLNKSWMFKLRRSSTLNPAGTTSRLKQSAHTLRSPAMWLQDKATRYSQQ